MPLTTETVSEYLTNIARAQWPASTVYESDRGDFRLERDGESVGLGRSHPHALGSMRRLAESGR